MKKIKYIAEIAILVVLFAIIISTSIARNYVSNYYYEGQGFEWEVRAETSANLPLMFAKVDFHHTGFYGNNCEKEIMLYGDDNDIVVSYGGNAYAENPELYPNNVNVLYYSFSENKFYGGKFKLDYNKLIPIAERLRNEVIKTEGIGKTQSIIFYLKVFPKGKVVVSMDSYFGSRSESKSGKTIIATFQAKPENHDWSVFEQQDNASTGGIGNSNSVVVQRALLLNKYDWSVEVSLPKDRIMRSFSVDTYGNKSLEMDTIKNSKNPSYGNFIYLPKELDVDYKNIDSTAAYNRTSFNFEFDELEIIKAFETASNNRKNAVRMQLIIKDDKSVIKAILNGNGKSIPIKNKDSVRY